MPFHKRYLRVKTKTTHVASNELMFCYYDLFRSDSTSHGSKSKDRCFSNQPSTSSKFNIRFVIFALVLYLFSRNKNKLFIKVPIIFHCLCQFPSYILLFEYLSISMELKTLLSTSLPFSPFLLLHSSFS